MDLESDLGIDSIKRVEILAALNNRVPGLPDIAPARLAKLRTLEEILRAVGEDGPPDGPVPPASPPRSRPTDASRTPPGPPSASDAVSEAPLAASPPRADTPRDSRTASAASASTPGRAPLAPPPASYAMVATGGDARMTLAAAAVTPNRGPLGPPPGSFVMTPPPSAPPRDPSRLPPILLMPPPDATPPMGTPIAPPRTPKATPFELTRLAAAPADVARFVVHARPSAAVGLAAPGLFGPGRIAIIPDDGGVAAALRDRLAERGIAADVTARLPDAAHAAIFLGGLRAIAGPAGALAIQREAFELAQALAPRAVRGGALLVTVQDTGGDLGASGRGGPRAWLGGLAGLAKTAAEEWPASCARAIDLERGDRSAVELADALLAELLTGGAEREVGLGADGSRVVLEAVAATLPAQTAPAVREPGVVVVSGGARGVTAACLIALAGATRDRFVVLGRTRLALADDPPELRGITDDAEMKRAALAIARREGRPSAPRDIARDVAEVVAARDVRATLARLTELGAEVRYAAVDVRDAAALEVLLADVRRQWGPIRGLVHAAGVLGDALLEHRRDPAQLDRVLETKILGFAALLAATRADPLRWICAFSSLAARGGNAGQADYAMANEVLNKVAAAQAAARGIPAIALGWGPWAGGMVSPALARQFAARGVPLIAVPAGAAAFVEEILAAERGAAPVEILRGAAGWPASSASAAVRRGELRITRASSPHLFDHGVQGHIVLPLALALEWLARLAPPPLPGRPLVIRQLHIVRGVRLPAEAAARQILRLAARPLPGGELALELRDADDAVRISALAAARAPRPPAAPVAPPTGIALEPPWYGRGRLFHGPRFHVLEAVDAVSADGAAAALRGSVALGWRGGPWRTDPAAVDGALQLAALANLASDLGPTLPLRIDEVVLYGPAEDGPLRCALRLRHRNSLQATFDAWIGDARGAPVAELSGLEMFPIPNGFAAE